MNDSKGIESAAASPRARGLGGGWLLAIAYLGFVSLGLPDPVAGVAWPSVREAFELPQRSFGLIFLGLGCGYWASSFFGGKLTNVLGLGNLLWVSSGLVAAAMFGSGLAPAWLVMVGCSVVWGLGSGGIDAGLNAYVSSHFSARVVNWLHACYSLGATLGPLVMTAMVVRMGSWRLGYVVVGGVLLAMTLLFLVTRDRWSGLAESEHADRAAKVGVWEALRHPVVGLHVALFFLYVGLEFTVGQWSFTLLTESRGARADVAGLLAGSYFAAIGAGRILSGGIAHWIGLDGLIRLSMGLALVGTLLFAVGQPMGLGFVGLLLIGLGLAPVFPCLMAQTPRRMPPAFATHAFGFQVSSGMLGAALAPSLAGLLVAGFGLEAIPRMVVVLAVLLLGVHEVVVLAAKPKDRASSG